MKLLGQVPPIGYVGQKYDFWDFLFFSKQVEIVGSPGPFIDDILFANDVSFDGIVNGNLICVGILEKF